MKVVTISSRLNFGRPAPPGRGSAAGQKFWVPRYYGQRAVFASLRVLFFIFSVIGAIQIRDDDDDDDDERCVCAGEMW